MSENCQNSLVYLLVISLENNNKKNRPKCSVSLHLHHNTLTVIHYLSRGDNWQSHTFWCTCDSGIPANWLWVKYPLWPLSHESDQLQMSIFFVAFAAAFVIHYLSRGDNWQSKTFWCTCDPGIPANTVAIEYPLWPYCPSLTSCKQASFFQSTVQFA